VKKLPRATLAFWSAMEQTFGRFGWHAVHGLNPSPAWCKLLAKHDDRAHAFVLRKIREGWTGGTLVAPASLEEIERLFAEAVDFAGQEAQRTLRAVWWGAVCGHLDTAASFAGLVGPKGRVAEMAPWVLEIVQPKAQEMLASALSLLADGRYSVAEVDACVARTADAFMRELKRTVDAAIAQAAG
jgi:hypothetical protein